MQVMEEKGYLEPSGDGGGVGVGALLPVTWDLWLHLAPLPSRHSHGSPGSGSLVPKGLNGNKDDRRPKEK